MFPITPDSGDYLSVSCRLNSPSLAGLLDAEKDLQERMKVVSQVYDPS